MAAGYEFDAGELHRLTGGNPFYVHEVLEAGGDEVPATVGEAVYTRAARMSATPDRCWRSVSVALVGARAVGARGGLRRRCARRSTSAWSAACWSTTTAARGFRHELARMAIEAALGPSRRRGAASARCWRRWAIRRAGIDPARLAHHAEGRTTLRPCSGWRPRRRAGRRRSARTARRRRSTPARCGSPRPRPAVRASRAARRGGGRAVCDRRPGRLDRRPELARIGAATARPATWSARATRSAGWSRRTLPRRDGGRPRGGRRRGARCSSRSGRVAGTGRRVRLALAACAVRRRSRRGDRVGRARDRVRRRRRCHAGQRDDLGRHARGCCATARTPSRMLEQALEAVPGARARAGDRRARTTTLPSRASSTAPTRWRIGTSRQGLAYCAEHDLDLWTLSLLGVKVRSQLNQGHYDEASEVALQLAGELRDSPAPRFEGPARAGAWCARAAATPESAQALEQAGADRATRRTSSTGSAPLAALAPSRPGWRATRSRSMS